MFAEANPEQMRQRTKEFALRVVKLYRALPRTTDAQEIGRQLLRCSLSVAANYRTICGARSRADFASKLAVVLEEADEAVFWLEMLADSGIVSKRRIGPLTDEAKQLVKIFGASRRTVRSGTKVSNGCNN